MTPAIGIALFTGVALCVWAFLHVRKIEARLKVAESKKLCQCGKAQCG